MCLAICSYMYVNMHMCMHIYICMYFIYKKTEAYQNRRAGTRPGFKQSQSDSGGEV